MMPPPGRQPAARIRRFARSLVRDDARRRRADRMRATSRCTGSTAPSTRAIEDLLGLDIDVNAVLPRDIEVDGFDNIAAVLKVSPSFLEQYISCARGRAQAVGEPKPRCERVLPAAGREAERAPRRHAARHSRRDGGRSLFPGRRQLPDRYRRALQAGLVPAASRANTSCSLLVDGVKVFARDVGGEDDLKNIDQVGRRRVAEIGERFRHIPVDVKAGAHAWLSRSSRARLPSPTTRLGVHAGR